MQPRATLCLFLAWAAWLCAAMGCRRRVDDCEAFEQVRRGERLAHPALSQGPAQFAEAIEACFAGGDSRCDKALALVQATPGMAISSLDTESSDRSRFLRACARLERDEQFCLTSYRFHHPERCDVAAVQQRLNELLAIP